MSTEPAIVRGNQESAIAVFIEDSRGDLVDIEFYCITDGRCGKGHLAGTAPLVWPAFAFSTDYDVHCNACGVLINRAEE
mgnify:CR=1